MTVRPNRRSRFDSSSMPLHYRISQLKKPCLMKISCSTQIQQSHHHKRSNVLRISHTYAWHSLHIWCRFAVCLWLFAPWLSRTPGQYHRSPFPRPCRPWLTQRTLTVSELMNVLMTITLSIILKTYHVPAQIDSKSFFFGSICGWFRCRETVSCGGTRCPLTLCIFEPYAIDMLEGGFYVS